MQAPSAEALARYSYSDKKEVRIPGRMLRSKAYIELSDTAKHVLHLFLQRRTWYTEGKGRNTKRIFQNNGLLFSYSEANNLWGIPSKTFRRAIIQLIEHGFIRIENHGGTLQGTRVCSTYRLVEDWQHYGTDLFVKPEIPASICYSRSIQKLNASRATSRESKFSTVMDDSGRLSLVTVEGTKRKVKHGHG